MPGFDGKGPPQSRTGRRRGICRGHGASLSGFLLQLLLENWQLVVSLLVAVLSVAGRRLYLLRSPQKKPELPVLTAKKITDNSSIKPS